MFTNKMGNGTIATPPPTLSAVDRFKQPEWIIAEIYNVLAIATVTWTSVGLVVNGRRTGKWKKENAANHSQINAGAVYTAAVAPFLLSYIRLVADQVTFNIGYNDGTPWPCETAMDVSVVGYTLTITCVYVFLWFRQRSLYQHPSMSLENRPWLRFVNWTCLVVMVVGVLFSGIGFTYPNNYTYSNRGCVSRADFTVWPIYISNVISVVMQAMMLFLFLYPLRSQAGGSNASRVLRILKRSAVFAVVCVASDLFAVVMLAAVVPKDTTRHVTVTVYDINMMINLMGVLLSFETWPDILTSCWSKRTEPKKSREVLSSSGSAMTGDGKP